MAATTPPPPLDVRYDTRPPAAGPHNIELLLYVGAQLHSRATGLISPATKGNHFTFNLDPATDGRNYARVNLVTGAQIGPWQWLEVDLTIDAFFWGSRKPLVYYSGEPTDWASGLTRWSWDGVPPARAVAAALTIRRTDLQVEGK